MDVHNAMVCETQRTGIFLLHYIRREYLQTHGCFWYISCVSDVSNLPTFLVTVDKMADPELARTFAFYGSILLAKMGLMSPLTIRQRFTKMVNTFVCSTLLCSMLLKSFARCIPTQRIRLMEGLCLTQTQMLSVYAGPIRMTWRTSPSSCLSPTSTWRPTLQLLWPQTWSGDSPAWDFCIVLSTWTRYVTRRRDSSENWKVFILLSRSRNHQGHSHSSSDWASPSTCVVPLPSITCKSAML